MQKAGLPNLPHFAFKVSDEHLFLPTSIKLFYPPAHMTESYVWVEILPTSVNEKELFVAKMKFLHLKKLKR